MSLYNPDFSLSDFLLLKGRFQTVDEFKENVTIFKNESDAGIRFLDEYIERYSDIICSCKFFFI